jgi:hypothetical protein
MKSDPRLAFAFGMAFGMAFGAGVAASGLALAQDRTNPFDDPFLQVSAGLADCPVPEEPMLTATEVRAVEHERVQHGTSRYASGRCRLPNSYLYDKEIIPRVAQFIQRDGRFDDTSIWVLDRRRIVTLMGCVQSREQADTLARSVALVDEVMVVMNQLMIGTRGHPPTAYGRQPRTRPMNRPESRVRGRHSGRIGE